MRRVIVAIGLLTSFGCSGGATPADAPGTATGSASSAAGGGSVGSGSANAGGSGAVGSGSGSSNGTGGNAGVGGSPGPTKPSSGCGNPAAFHGEKEIKVTLPAVSNTPTERSYLVLAPEAADYDTNKPLPVIFMFHGAGGTKGFYYNLQNAAGGESGKNAIFVSPQGIIIPPYESYGFGWNEECGGFDMAFFDSMLAEIASDFCVDANRVFVAGYSWGGDMANSLGCCRGDKVRGVIPTGGGEMLVDKNQCTATTSAYRLSTGDQDTSYSKPSIEGVVDFYQAAHGCKDTFTTVVPSDAAGSCKVFDGCDAPVMQCSHTGLGHTPPPQWEDDVWNFVKSF